MFEISPNGILTIPNQTETKVLSAIVPSMISWLPEDNGFAPWNYAKATGGGSATRARQITLTYNSGFVVTFEVSQKLDDIAIEITLKNGGTQTIVNPTINLANFTFDGPIDGSTILSANQQQAMPDGYWYPSTDCPLGCVSAWQGSTGVSVWCPSEVDKPHIIYRATADGSPANQMHLNLVLQANLAPGVLRMATVAIRVTNDITPSGLLSGYKAAIPARSYSPSSKPWMAWNLRSHEGDGEDLSTDTGLVMHLRTVASSLGAGVIYWAPGGEEKDMYPCSPSANIARLGSRWKTLISILKAMNLTVGICLRATWIFGADGVTPFSPNANNPNDVAFLLAEVDRAWHLGVNAFYVDSTGGDYNSALLLKAIRSHVGGLVPLFSEAGSDFSAKWSGRYCEWDAPGLLGLPESQRIHLQYLYPAGDWLCIDRSATLTPLGFSTRGLKQLYQI